MTHLASDWEASQRIRERIKDHRSCLTCDAYVGIGVSYGGERGDYCSSHNKRAHLRGFPHKRTTCPYWRPRRESK